MSKESDAIFTKMLREQGIPTTEAELKTHFHSELQAAGSRIANTSPESPFFNLLAAIVTKPALWLTNSVLPNLTLQYATGVWLESIAWSCGLKRNPATKAEGSITFFRENSNGELPVPAGTAIQSAEIDGTVYRLVTTVDSSIPDGSLGAKIPARAEKAGEAHNLGEGYCFILSSPVSGIAQVKNESG